MKIYYLLILSAIILVYISPLSRCARGGGRGGSRGGRGSRGGSWRSSSSSSRTHRSAYVRWQSRSGIGSGVRYRSSTYLIRRDAIIHRHILISNYYYARVRIHSSTDVDGFAICVNTDPLYGRNVSTSPWFVCPWINDNSYYCCGDEFEEHCCRYFDRPWHLAGLVIGCIILAFMLLLMCFCCCICCFAKTGEDVDVPSKIEGQNEDINMDSMPCQPYPTGNKVTMPPEPNKNYRVVAVDSDTTNPPMAPPPYNSVVNS